MPETLAHNNDRNATIPLKAYNGRLLGSLFRLRQSRLQQEAVMETLQILVHEAEKFIYEGLQQTTPPTSQEIVDCLSKMELREHDINKLRSQVHEKLGTEGVITMLMLSRDFLIAETVEQVEYVASLKTDYEWPGSLLVIRPLLPDGQEGDNLLNSIVTACNNSNIEYRVASTFDQV